MAAAVSCGRPETGKSTRGESDMKQSLKRQPPWYINPSSITLLKNVSVIFVYLCALFQVSLVNTTQVLMAESSGCGFESRS